MAPRSARASAPAKTISKTSKAKPTSKEHADAGKRHAKPEPAPTPRPKMNVPKRWLKDPDREWFIKSGAKSDKRKKAPHYYTVACRTKIWSCTCPDFLYRKRRQHSDCKHIVEIKRSHRAPDAVHAYALSDETIAQLKEYQKDKAAERREARSAKDGGAPAKKAESEPFLKEPPPPGLPEGCHERHERAVRSANKRMFEKMTVEEMKHQLRAQDQLITGTRRELIDRCTDLRTYGLLPRCPECGGGKLHVRYRIPVAHGGMGRFKCYGFYEEDHYHWCNYRSEREYRAPWVDQPPLHEGK